MVLLPTFGNPTIPQFKGMVPVVPHLLLEHAAESKVNALLTNGPLFPLASRRRACYACGETAHIPARSFTMFIACENKSLLLPVRTACFFLIVLTAACQSPKPATSAPISLQPYTATDQTASAGVPSGWKVQSGAQTVITLTGPQGETVSLGNTYIARNAAFQLGQPAANGVDLAMPYSATLAQKLQMVLQQGAAVGKQPFSQFVVTSTSPLQLPATLGQCARFVGGYTGSAGPAKFLIVFCSLPLDPVGDYKNIMLYASAPAATAAQSAPTAQAIFQSYRIPTAWLQRKLAPVHAPASTAASAGSSAEDLAKARAIMSSTNYAAQGSAVSANCFDLSVLRQTPAYQLPRSCGGTKPD